MGKKRKEIKKQKRIDLDVQDCIETIHLSRQKHVKIKDGNFQYIFFNSVTHKENFDD